MLKGHRHTRVTKAQAHVRPVRLTPPGTLNPHPPPLPAGERLLLEQHPHHQDHQADGHRANDVWGGRHGAPKPLCCRCHRSQCVHTGRVAGAVWAMAAALQYGIHPSADSKGHKGRAQAAYNSRFDSAACVVAVAQLACLMPGGWAAAAAAGRQHAGFRGILPAWRCQAVSWDASPPHCPAPPHTHTHTYAHHLQMIVEKDGVSGLFFRGLGTKLVTNGMQVRAARGDGWCVVGDGWGSCGVVSLCTQG